MFMYTWRVFRCTKRYDGEKILSCRWHPFSFYSVPPAQVYFEKRNMSCFFFRQNWIRNNFIQNISLFENNDYNLLYNILSVNCNVEASKLKKIKLLELISDYHHIQNKLYCIHFHIKMNFLLAKMHSKSNCTVDPQRD